MRNAKNEIKLGVLLVIVFSALSAESKLLVKVSPPKVAGSKAVVKVEIKNGFSESARAQLFLLIRKARWWGR